MTGNAGNGINILSGPGNEWYILHDNPPKLTRWNNSDICLGSVDFAANSFSSPIDITFADGLDLLVLFDRSNEIARFNRRLTPLTPIVPFIESDQLELLSICGTADGNMYALNWNDENVWQINRDKNAFPIKIISPHSRKPSKIRFCKDLNQIILLGDDHIRTIDRFGNPIAQKTLDNPLAAGNLVIYRKEAWLVGNGIECLSLPELKNILTFSNDSLKYWGVFPPRDIMLTDDETMYILPENGNFIQKVRIIRSGEDGK